MSATTEGYRRGINRAWKMAQTPIDELSATKPPTADEILSRTLERTLRQMKTASREVNSMASPSYRDSSPSRSR